MNAKKSLIALSVFSILMGGVWEAAVAKKAEKEDDSVRRWGRWAVLAPAAGQEEVAGFTPVVAGNDLGSCESSENCPTIVIKQVEPESPCEAGKACGFTRIDYPRDVAEKTAPNNSDIVPFDLRVDTKARTAQFLVSGNAIDSGTVPAKITFSPILQKGTITTLPGYGSDLKGTILARTEVGEPSYATGKWLNESLDSSEETTVNGGEFVWGITATADEMQGLVSQLGNDLTATYQGKTMGVLNGNEGIVSLLIDFDDPTSRTGASWRGQFDTSDVDFTASGVVVDSGFVSNANGFSDNIVSGEVKGGFVNGGMNAIGGYDVVDFEGTNAVDVFYTSLQVESPQ